MLGRDAAQSMALPRLVRLGSEGIVGAQFEVMKTLPALRIIDTAIARGEIRAHTTVVETTSGTFGLGLAMVCAIRGIGLHLVSDPAIDGFLRARIEDLGARVTVVRAPDPIGGYQTARLREVRRVCAGTSDTYVPSQYGNPRNPEAYASVAQHILEHVGPPSCVVGPVGSGGSMCGTVRALRRAAGPQVRAVAVDTHGSVLFGQQDSPRLLRGLGNSLLPPNLDHTVFDEVQWLPAPLAFAATRLLHRRHALYMGPTSGAAYAAARDTARRHAGPVVVLLPDTGHRYEHTVYDEAWIAREVGPLPDLPDGPESVAAPPTLGDGWLRMPWQRRSRTAVLTQTLPTSCPAAG